MSKCKEPAARRIETITLLPDGSTEYKLSTGGIVIVPPLPENKAWRDRAAREMSDINYGIIRRIISMSVAEQPGKTADSDRTNLP